MMTTTRRCYVMALAVSLIAAVAVDSFAQTDTGASKAAKAADNASTKAKAQAGGDGSGRGNGKGGGKTRRKRKTSKKDARKATRKTDTKRNKKKPKARRKANRDEQPAVTEETSTDDGAAELQELDAPADALAAVDEPSLDPAAPATETGTPLMLRAAQQPQPESPPTEDNGWIFKLLLLGVVVGAGGWLFAKRRRNRPESVVADLRVVSRASLGGRAQLVVVELGGRTLLLGVTPSQVTRLDELAPSAQSFEPSLVSERAEAPSMASGFAGALGEVEKKLARYRSMSSTDGAADEAPPHEDEHDDAVASEPPNSATQPARPQRAGSRPSRPSRPPRHVTMVPASMSARRGGRQAESLARLRRKAS